MHSESLVQICMQDNVCWFKYCYIWPYLLTSVFPSSGKHYFWRESIWMWAWRSQLFHMLQCACEWALYQWPESIQPATSFLPSRYIKPGVCTCDILLHSKYGRRWKPLTIPSLHQAWIGLGQNQPSICSSQLSLFSTPLCCSLIHHWESQVFHCTCNQVAWMLI